MSPKLKTLSAMLPPNSPITPKVHGSVKWFSDLKGFGFLVCDNDPTYVFGHYFAIQSEGYKSIREGQRVAFVLESGPEGLQAFDVEVL